jgi:hypothetical protein
MADYVCEQCGTLNAFGTAFCVSCGSFLAWDEVEHDGERGAGQRSEPASVPAGSAPPPGQLDETAVRPAIRVPASGRQPVSAVASSSAKAAPGDTTRGVFWARAEQSHVSVPATGEPQSLDLRVANTSPIVDGFVVDAPASPDWLAVEAVQVRLLPGTDETVTVQLRVASPTLVPAQERPVMLRIRPITQTPAQLEVAVLVTVPVLDAPVRLRAEPRLLRLRDRDTAECTVVVDNAGSNHPVQIRFSGSDPEMVVRFRFDPPTLTLGPAASGSARLVVTTPGPEPGHESSRTVTVAALDGTRSVETVVTLQQSTTARAEDPPVAVEVQPSILRVRDSKVGKAHVSVNNRGGSDWAHVRLKASDPEGVVFVIWDQTLLHVPPGHAMQAELLIEAPLPDPGTEVTRTVTVSATDGRRTSSTTATFVQTASPSAMGSLVLRLEPSLLRVRDSDGARGQVVLDNRRGRSAVRISLEGRDPERAIGFDFSPAVVELGAGQVQAVALGLRVPRPGPGQEVTRPFTVTAGDGRQSVEATGSLVQGSSPAAIESLAVRLDPSVLRLSTRRRGRVTAVIDNRKGVEPVHVSLRGDDPENAIRFRFSPARLTVPAGRAATTTVTVDAQRAPAGQELTRPLVVMATEGDVTVTAEGSLVQTPVDRRPLTRLLLTLLGGAAMIAGAFQTWTPWPRTHGGEGWYLTLGALGQPFHKELDLSSLLPAGITAEAEAIVKGISVGMVTVGLAVLLILGVTGRSGRLSRIAAVAGALLVVVILVVASQALPGGAQMGSGAFLVLAGCVAGYVGGALRPR